MAELPENISLFILDSNSSTSLFITHYNKCIVDFPSFPGFEWDPFIIDPPKGEEFILGYDLLYHFDHIIDCKNGVITYDSSGIIPYNSNKYATSVNSASLFGELKETSLLSSIHISPIIPS
ncbi:hypothetical protein O181_011650 [Austropuccinia psidii MF-1]|uniref:Uncharacterized protein n=1 Tax=Austropuccinia psidii MF-1 TaxID=1389203 RepID=A0A9Q3BVJ7_9BASI|nr:hypothetical protein [Austropuccinia psidii MF-1]